MCVIVNTIKPNNNIPKFNFMCSRNCGVIYWFFCDLKLEGASIKVNSLIVFALGYFYCDVYPGCKLLVHFALLKYFHKDNIFNNTLNKKGTCSQRKHT